MDLNEYQREAQKTSIYPASAKIIYPALGLAGEVGEVANQVKKIIRDDGGQLTDDRKMKIIDELGDVLWYAAAITNDLGLSLEIVAQKNLFKLSNRRTNNLIRGDQRSLPE
jgi:NTP pyrophosphatase (non-canonical NTP hydrolase)